MKKILTLIVALFAFTSITFGQSTALTVQGGYSWSYGMVGVEYQMHQLSIAAGYMPTTMPGSGDAISSYSAAITMYGKEWYKSCLYGSIAFASKGYRSEMNYNSSSSSSSWTDGFTAPMGIATGGLKLNTNLGINARVGVGLGWCEYATVFTYEFTIGWSFGEK